MEKIKGVKKTDSYRGRLLSLAVGEFIELADRTEWKTVYHLCHSHLNRGQAQWRVTNRRDLFTDAQQWRAYRVK